ncbi:MAG: DEAD/DEAH box helicase [Deltaproteobacteria bacterium]|nr:DEAD/DEAH box helicase [Deltaproteobacteria bacterium]
MKNNYRRKSFKSSNSGRNQRLRTGFEKPRLDPALKEVFRKIGVPESGPIIPDPFQLEALELVEDYDLLVSAPTGAGKTWIAEKTIASYLSQGLKVWYASPLKALTNSIYQGFCDEFGPSCCGILTGDRKENPSASVIVGTTEILRNQLYDAMYEGASIQTDLVILDEAHYLSDPYRGVVWEEILIYLPSRVRLLLLSATISNADEVCVWLQKIRGNPNRVISLCKRPVPLEMLFIFPDGRIAPLGSKKGLNPKVKKYLVSTTGTGKRRKWSRKIDFGNVIRCLKEFDLLPTIFFLKSKKDCDHAILSCPQVERPAREKDSLDKEIKKFLEEYPYLKGHRQMNSLIKSRVASHHGGQLPYWKVLVEKMMNMGALEAIFSTSTVAAGVNFPARSVVLVQSDKFNGREFLDLTATELHQMIGRAGRRGKDHIGFAMIIPGPHQDPQLLNKLKDSPPEPILSQIHINFSMTLNLLLSHSPLEVKTLLERSFAAFRERESYNPFKRQWDQMLSDLQQCLQKGRCDTTDPFEVIEYIDKKAVLEKELKRTARDTKIEGLILERLDSFPCKGCAHQKLCHGKKKGVLFELLQKFRSSTEHMDEMTSGLWINFKRHMRFLNETGFADDKGRLTADGYWATNLRLDQPLLIAETIRKGTLNGVSPQYLAAGLAPFVWDRSQDVVLRTKEQIDLKPLEAMFNRILISIEQIKDLKNRRGFESPPIMFWPSAALYMWSRGMSWEKLIYFVQIDEGGMASLIMRTADHLKQIINLKDTHPELASVAENAIELILREPVYLD